METQWPINNSFEIVERVVNTPHTSHPSSPFIFEPEISTETLPDAADREHAARTCAMVQSKEQAERIKETVTLKLDHEMKTSSTGLVKSCFAELRNAWMLQNYDACCRKRSRKRSNYTFR